MILLRKFKSEIRTAKRHIRDLLSSPHSDARRLASAESIKDATIIVSCYDNFSDVRHNNWGNLTDALRRCTPGGSCVWDGVAFVRGESPRPDWHLIFNNIDWHRQSVQFRGSPNRTIFAVCEPPTRIHKPWHVAQGDGTIVLTCDETLSLEQNPPRRYITKASLTPSWTVNRSYDFLKTNNVITKPKKLSWVCSNESSLQGHLYRLKFLERLKDRVRFDHFGRGFNPIADKWDALAPYRYSLAFENFQSNYYFTEKLTDCFVSETMPIYFGSKLITEFFPADSLVNLDPEDPDVFKIIKDVSNSNLWQKNRDAVLEAKRLVLDEYNLFARLAKFMKNTTDEPQRRRRMTVKNIKLNYTNVE